MVDGVSENVDSVKTNFTSYLTTMSSQTGFAEAGAVKVLFCVNGYDLGFMIRLN